MSVSDTVELTFTSDGLNRRATVTSQFNKYVYIYDMFPNGYTPGVPFKFTVKGFINPPTASPTGSFHISIFYEEDTNEVSSYRGTSELIIIAEPSHRVTFGIEHSEDQTGDFNQNFTFYGSTLDNLPIEKGSYLRVFIPEDFKITDYDRVASTCHTISGFSDEISCELEGLDGYLGPNGPVPGGHYLTAKGGFDSI